MLDNLQLNDSAAEKVVESLDKHLGETYDLAINPTAKELGTGLASVVRLVFSPFRVLDNPILKEKVSTFIKELIDKRKKIPDNKIVEPDYQVVYVALENIKSCITNDELRHMFVNLICNSMNSDIKNEIHPSFAAIIKELSSLDAQILEMLYQKRLIPVARFERKEFHLSSGGIITSTVDVVIANEEILNEQSSSIANLERLNLICFSPENKYFSVSEYEELWKIYYKHFDGVNTNMRNCYIEITEYGLEFMKSCYE